MSNYNNGMKMPLSDIELHKVITDISSITTDIKYIREALVEIEMNGRERDRRISSLETSRNYVKAIIVALWAGLAWIGWEWIEKLFRS